MQDPALLVKNESFYRALLESLQMGVYSCDGDGYITYFNEGAVNLLGYRPQGEDITFSTCFKVWLPGGTVVPPEETPMAIALTQGRPFRNVEAWVERPDGSRFYASMNIDIIHDQNGNFAGAVNMFRDVANREPADQAPVVGEGRYQQLVKLLPVATYTCNAQGQITSYNDAAVALWGREPQHNDRWCGAWKIFDRDGRAVPLEDCPIAIALGEGRAVEGEMIIVERPDGTQSYVMPHPKPMFDPSGRIVGAVDMLIDLTNEKRSHQILEESMERLRLAIDAAELGMWDMDIATGSVVTSERHRRIIGYDEKSNWTREQFLARLHPDDLLRVDLEFNMAMETGKLFYEARIIHPDKTVRWIRVNGVTLYSNSVPVRILGTVVDITAQQEANDHLEKIVAKRTKELRRLNKQLEKSNHDLEQFAYIASHDLQEPLRKIQTFATLVENVNSELNRRKYLSKIRDEAQGMSALVRDVLLFSRLSAVPEFDRVDLNRIVEDVKAELDLLITEKTAIVKSSNLPTVMGIPRQLTQLISNIISNSLKFCKTQPIVEIFAGRPSKPEIKAHSRLRDDTAYVQLSIRDNGIGFEQKYADQIFNIFQRLNTRGAYPGNGIGLALCKKIVENHNGVIRAKSAPDQGTTIVITLPADARRF
jgi:PAS domain S-box-containing protein